jgi:clan AA aspartic protease
MGILNVNVSVGGVGEYHERIEAIDAIVDTGALHSLLPESLLNHLAIEKEWLQEFVLADRTKVQYPVGHAMFYINGEERRCPAIFAPQEENYLLGATTLENFSLSVDPVNQELVKVNPHIRLV